MSARKISVGLLCVTWAAVGVGAAGALSAPKYYCTVGEGMPTSEVLLITGLCSGAFLFLAAAILESARVSSLREAATSFAILGPTLAAVIGVLLLWEHQTSTWWHCG